MNIPIFWRLILSHLGILMLSGAACLYSIVQLGALSGTARTALESNHRMIDYQETLTDAFLSQVRYGGKYLITHADAHHAQLRQFKTDFLDYLARLKSRNDSQPITASLSRIERFHEQYHELFDREVEFIRAKQTYAQSRYQQERDKVVESAIHELDGLKAQLRTKLQARLESIDHGARTARRITSLSTLIVLIFGTLLALKISSNIAAPLMNPAATQPRLAMARLRELQIRGVSFVDWARMSVKLAGQRFAALALALAAVWNRRSNLDRTRRQGKAAK